MRRNDARIRRLQKVLADGAAAGDRRKNVVAGRYAWPVHLCALLDELRESQVPVAEFFELELALRDIVRMSLPADALAVHEALGEALARESLAEGMANAECYRLNGHEDCTVRLRNADDALAAHQARIAHARLIIQRDLGQLGDPAGPVS